MSQSQHTIAGTVLTMPVRIRKADVHTAMFSVPADSAQKLIDYSGLRVCQFRPGRAVVNLTLRARPQVLKTYTYSDGTTREVPWEMKNSGVRFRPGGATLRLGDHPYAKELASLGLPKRAMVSGSVANVDMTFGDAHILR